MTDALDILVIIGMAIATLLCRTSGYIIMGYVPLTPRVRRGLEALPGAVVVSLVVPAGLSAGISGLVGIAAAILAMWATRKDILALAAGVGSVIAVRALGF